MIAAAHSVQLPRAAPARVLACGAFLKNRACLLDGHTLRWSQAHGDLGDPAARTALADSVEALLAEARGPLHAVAHDLHPDFPSTTLALTLADRLGVPAVPVQHHHAHAAVVLAERGSEGPAIALALDGFGFGLDGSAWGGEVLRVGPARRLQRLAHLPLLALPGGDAAAREPWRLAAAVLFSLGRGDEIGPRFAAVVGSTATAAVLRMLERGLNCPRSSSAGRWFDAAAAALGLSLRQSNEAEAAMALEALAAEAGRDDDDRDNSQHDNQDDDLPALVAALFDLPPARRAQGAARFHAALARLMAGHAIAAARAHATRQVLLVGGCMANRVLVHALRRQLQGAGLDVHLPVAAGCGDAGLALGQAWVVAHSLASSLDNSLADTAPRSSIAALQSTTELEA